MPSRHWWRLIFGAGAALLAACTFGPNYRRPPTPEPQHFAHAGESGLKEDSPVAHFWTLFNDATLNQLVADALAQNKDLKIAMANLRAARAARRLAGFDLYPTVTAEGSFQRTLLSERELPG